jgi:hypothetical protein
LLFLEGDVSISGILVENLDKNNVIECFVLSVFHISLQKYIPYLNNTVKIGYNILKTGKNHGRWSIFI